MIGTEIFHSKLQNAAIKMMIFLYLGFHPSSISIIQSKYFSFYHQNYHPSVERNSLIKHFTTFNLPHLKYCFHCSGRLTYYIWQWSV